MYSPPLNSGFTLAESLVAVLVLGILSTIAAPSFLTWVNQKKVDDVLAQVEGTFREAQGVAIKKSQACTLNLGVTLPGKPDSIGITATPTDCLPTGSRDLSQLGLSALQKNDTGIELRMANLDDNPDNKPQLNFSHKGTIFNQPNPGVIVVYNPQAEGRKRCLAISGSLGLMRTGEYTGSLDNLSADECDTSR